MANVPGYLQELVGHPNLRFYHKCAGQRSKGFKPGSKIMTYVQSRQWLRLPCREQTIGGPRRTARRPVRWTRRRGMVPGTKVIAVKMVGKSQIRHLLRTCSPWPPLHPRKGLNSSWREIITDEAPGEQLKANS